MIKYKTLIIGNNLEKNQLGSMLVRASQAMELPLAVSDTSWDSYAPSMKHSWGKIFFRIAKKRPLEWWSFNRKTIETIKETTPKLVIVTGIFPIKNEIFDICNRMGIKIVNYLTDSPSSKQNAHPIFRKNLLRYDIIFSTKKDIIPDLNSWGAMHVCFLPFGFDPYIHRCLSTKEFEQDESLQNDACFIGGADADRKNFINDFLPHFKGKLGLYGDYWYQDRNLKQFDYGFVYGDAFCKTIQSCKINLGLVRRKNSDGHSMRSYEIPACGGVGVYEDTPEHRDLFYGYPEYGFFSSPQDLAAKCNWLLEHPEEREQMRQLGIQLIVKESNTYEARLREILESVNK